MAIDLYDTLTLAEHWACAIEYGDYTGLDDDEAQELDAWLTDYPGAVFVWGDEPLETIDAISGSFARCLEVNIFMEAEQ